MTDVLRTPDERFADLPQFPYAPRYATVDGLRMHYLDEGPKDAPPVLLLHGEPSWCFLYRKMLPPLLGAGLRVIAPDLIGFGRSDKPARREEYTYARHVGWVRALLEQLDLKDITLFCQDWGGLIGLRLAGEIGERFARICAANTSLPTGDQRVPLAFKAWRAFSQVTPLFPVSRIVKSGCKRPVSDEVARAYDAPFPTEAHKAGARQFPLLVPTSPRDPAAPASRAAWEALRKWEKPFLCAFSDGDPITRGAERRLQKYIPGCAGQPHTTIRNAGHFLQEDAGEELGVLLVQWLGRARP